jgi:type I restriction enzyme S subunit
MTKNYKRLGDYIQEVKVRNADLKAEKLLGINIDKFFMPSVANVVGTDLSVYKIVKKNQFACNRMHVGRDYRLPISMSKTDEEFMVSPAYDVFEIIDTDILYPGYLMMWFSRREFDRNAWFYTDADVRGGLHWKALCDMQLPIPSITKQHEIVKEYNVIQNRIALNQQLIQKLEETARAIYKQWFVDFEFPDENGKPYKSNGGEMMESELGLIPKGWLLTTLGYVLSNKGYIRGPFGSALKKDDMIKSGIPVYEQQHAIDDHRNFRYFINSEKHKTLKRFTVCPDDFVISCSGTLGRVIMVKANDPIGIINQALLILRTDKNKLAPICLKYFLTSNDGNKLLIENSGGSAQINIAKREVIQDIPIIIPPPTEQIKVAEYLCKCDNKIELLKKESRLLDNLKNLLLSKLATIEN